MTDDSQQLEDVKIIRPNLSVENAFARHDLNSGVDTARVLGFPKHLFEFDIELERGIVDPWEKTIPVTVDLLTGLYKKSDVYPSCESHTYPTTSLLEPSLSRSRAAERAYSIVRRQITSWYTLFEDPEITITREERVFKLFWIVPAASEPDTISMIDTITGELVARDIAIEERAK